MRRLDDRHPLPGKVRRSVYGFLVLVSLDQSRRPAYEWERGDRLSAIAEPSPFTPEVDRQVAEDVPEQELEEEPEAEEEPDVSGHAMPEQQAAEGDEWWAKAYKGGPMVDVPGFPRPLYPKGHSKGQSDPGPDVKAYKRTVCRLGRWDPWQAEGWSDDYIKEFARGRGTGYVPDTGLRGVQRQQKMPETGVVDEKTFNMLRSARIPEADGFEHGGDMAMDAVAVNLLEQAWQKFKAKPKGDIEDVRRHIADFCVRSIRNASDWHYQQVRPMDYGVNPDAYHHDDDCSEHATCSLYWAKKQTGVAVPDPNDSGYAPWTGYGYTGTLIANPKCSAPYKVGDMAIYGPSTGNTSHVVTCYEPGDKNSAEWCSNGSESAPYGVELHYRSDLLCVVRPPLMP